MKYSNKFILILSLLFILCFWGCSKLKEENATPVSASANIHSDTYSSSHSADIKQGSNTLNDCKKCHGSDLSGGVAKVSCMNSKCHAHAFEYANIISTSFHGKDLKDKLSWNMDGCKSCHGSDYKGGTIQKSCFSCHKSGPEECSVCHGSKDSPAPPKDLSDNTSTTFSGVGAHQEHLKTGSKRVGVKCSECHTVPSSFNSPGHIGSALPAEVIFNDSLTNTMTKGSNKAVKIFDRSDLTCKNTYCHGNFTNGNNYSPKWTKVNQKESECGTCHSIPPKGTHTPASNNSCYFCHNLTVDANNNIIDKTKHMNGKLEVLSQIRTDW